MALYGYSLIPKSERGGNVPNGVIEPPKTRQPAAQGQDLPRYGGDAPYNSQMPDYTYRHQGMTAPNAPPPVGDPSKEMGYPNFAQSDAARSVQNLPRYGGDAPFDASMPSYNPTPATSGLITDWAKDYETINKERNDVLKSKADWFKSQQDGMSRDPAMALYDASLEGLRKRQAAMTSVYTPPANFTPYADGKWASDQTVLDAFAATGTTPPATGTATGTKPPATDPAVSAATAAGYTIAQSAAGGGGPGNNGFAFYDNSGKQVFYNPANGKWFTDSAFKVPVGGTPPPTGLTNSPSTPVSASVQLDQLRAIYGRDVAAEFRGDDRSKIYVNTGSGTAVLDASSLAERAKNANTITPSWRAGSALSGQSNPATTPPPTGLIKSPPTPAAAAPTTTITPAAFPTDANLPKSATTPTAPLQVAPNTSGPAVVTMSSRPATESQTIQVKTVYGSGAQVQQNPNGTLRVALPNGTVIEALTPTDLVSMANRALVSPPPAAPTGGLITTPPITTAPAATPPPKPVTPAVVTTPPAQNRPATQSQVDQAKAVYGAGVQVSQNTDGTLRIVTPDKQIVGALNPTTLVNNANIAQAKALASARR